ncbi:hypothetical protein [Pseudaestuariivita sp.]|uniref:hypothetical protein n=1 Tax=Pseudaestuariivita sp. TaxID=2211669 RepID=UPI0040592260
MSPPAPPVRVGGDAAETAAWQDDLQALEEAQTCAIDATYHLSRITDVFDAVERGDIPPQSLTSLLYMLAGTCRSVDRSLQDLRAVLSRRLRDRALGSERAAPPGQMHTAFDQIIDAPRRQARA